MPGLRRLPSSKTLLIDEPEQLQQVFAQLSDSRDDDEAAAAEVDDADNAGSPSARVSCRRCSRLEDKLRLSAQLGLGLLDKKESLARETDALQTKNRELEASISQLLDRLATAYRDNALVIKRAERAQANLDASEASNRQLLVTLEEDRKAVRRLSSQNTSRGDTSAAALSLQLEEAHHELDQARRLADAADARSRRSALRLSECDRRLCSLSKQLESSDNDTQAQNFAPPARPKSRTRPVSLNLGYARLQDDGLLISAIPERLADANADDFNALLRQHLEQIRSLLHEDSGRASQHARSPREIADRIATVQEEPIIESAMDGETLANDSPETGHADSEVTAYSASQRTSRVMQAVTETESTDDAASDRNESEKTSRGSLTSSRRRSLRLPPTEGRKRYADRTVSADFTGWSLRMASHEYAPQLPVQQPLSPMLYGRSPSPSTRALKPLTLGSSVGSTTSSLYSPRLSSSRQQSVDGDNCSRRQSVDVDVSRITHDDLDPELSTSSAPIITETGPSPVKSLHAKQSALTLTSPSRQRPDPMANFDKREVGVQTDVELPSGAMTGRVPHARTPFAESSSSIPASDLASLRSGPDRPEQTNVPQGSAPLTSMVEHITKLVQRLKSADLGSLEARLKRQNLPGDVQHLARSTVLDLLHDIEDLRENLRKALDDEHRQRRSANETTSGSTSDSLVSRRDFFALVKLFRDALFEAARLRVMINRIQLEPSLASKLKEMELLDNGDDLLSFGKSSDKSTAAAILAPLSRLIYGTEATNVLMRTQPSRPPMQKARTASARLAPKLEASSALAAATVNVQFERQGGIRRQVSIMPDKGHNGLSARYQEDGMLSRSPAPDVARRDLSRIFAGGSAYKAAPSDRWVMVQEQRSAAPPGRQTLSQNVNAVVDQTAAAYGDDFEPSLLERTLRPRGLSDSSIHSTFLSHANPATRIITPAGLALSGTSSGGLYHDATMKSPGTRQSSSRGAGGQLRKISAATTSSTKSGKLTTVADGVTESGSVSSQLSTSDGAAPLLTPTSQNSNLLGSLGSWAANKAGELASSFAADPNQNWPSAYKHTPAVSRRPSTRRPDA